MRTLKPFLLATAALSLIGCASPGPMQMGYGPMQTSAFEPIILDTVQDDSDRVRFKEWTTMYENKEFQRWGVFFITDNGVYMANWDLRAYEYDLVYKLPAKDIQIMSEDRVERSMWIDSDLFIIQDINGHEVGFALNGENAARSIIREIKEISSNTETSN